MNREKMIMMSSRNDRESMSVTTSQDDDMVLRRTSESDDSQIRKRKRASTCSFPITLFELLEDAEEEGYANIVSWLPNGTSFQIHDPTRFCDGIMTKFFRQTKLDSFTRQLYIYGFSKSTKKHGDRKQGPIFLHPDFRRGDLHACTAIARNQSGDRRLKKKNMIKTGETDMGHPSVVQMQQLALATQRRNYDHQRLLPVPSMDMVNDRILTRIPPTETIQHVLRVASEENQSIDQIAPATEIAGPGPLGWDLEPRTIEEMMNRRPL